MTLKFVVLFLWTAGGTSFSIGGAGSDQSPEPAFDFPAFAVLTAAGRLPKVSLPPGFALTAGQFRPAWRQWIRQATTSSPAATNADHAARLRDQHVRGFHTLKHCAQFGRSLTMITSHLPGALRRKLNLAGFYDDRALIPSAPVTGRRHFNYKYQRGRTPLAVTVAFGDDHLDQGEFQEQVLEGVRSAESKSMKALSDVTRLDKATKATLEDITRLKKTANDQQANVEALTRKLVQFDSLMARERAAAFGKPGARVLGDEQLCAAFNALCRKALLAPGERLPEFVAKALGEDTSPGSTLIDDRLLTEIYHTLGEFGVWNTFAVRRMPTKQTKLPISTVRVLVNAILTEGGTIADDTGKAGTVLTLEVEVLAGLINVSMQLIEDSEFDMSQVLLEEFAEAYANRLDHFALNAAGGANGTDGGMTGAIQGGTAAPAAAGNTSTELTDFEDWLRCLTTVDPIVLKRMAKFWIHPQIVARALAVKDGNGRPIFLTAIEAPSLGAVGSILGYPVVMAFAAPSANAANAKIAVFGDPNGNVVGVRTDFRFEGSDHHRWNTLERSFRGWGRAGTKIRRSQSFAVLTLPAV